MLSSSAESLHARDRPNGDARQPWARQPPSQASRAVKTCAHSRARASPSASFRALRYSARRRHAAEWTMARAARNGAKRRQARGYRFRR
jgi:hypothetical protein